MSRGETIRVIVVDDDVLLREALADLVSWEADLAIAGTAGDAESGIALAEAERPTVALVDVKMPGGGPAATRGILKVSPDTRVVAISAYDDMGAVRDMIRAGARGYVVKSGPSSEVVEEVVEAIRRAADRLGYLSPTVTADVVQDLSGRFDREIRATEEMEALHDRIDRALEPGAIRPVYQPIVDLRTLRVVGMEALARFTIPPSRTPDLWFKEATTDNRSTDLEMAALRVEAGAFDDPAFGGRYLSLNLSPSTVLEPSTIDFLLALPAGQVVLEITEHAQIHDYDALATALKPLREVGGRLAVDDAGAGYASLRHILRLQPDIIKLDIELTRNVDTDREKLALAAAFSSFASQLGKSIVAEGIETASEMATLQSLGITLGQGYYLRRPTSLEEALAPIEVPTS